jgi:hypothetical protein
VGYVRHLVLNGCFIQVLQVSNEPFKINYKSFNIDQKLIFLNQSWKQLLYSGCPIFWYDLGRSIDTYHEIKETSLYQATYQVRG